MKAAENASTGFKWMIDDTCVSVISFVSESVSPPENKHEPCYNEDGSLGICPDFHPMVGMPTVRLITIHADNKGSCVLRMAYARQWEFSFDDFDAYNGLQARIPIEVV